MPINIKVIHTRDFIRTKVDGSLDLSASRQILVALARMTTAPGDYHVLVDTRDAQVSLSPLDLYVLGIAVAEQPSLAQSTTALLVSLGEAERANLMALIAQKRGALLRVFTSFEEAITWLAIQEEEP
jgi:hypothetical protein